MSIEDTLILACEALLMAPYLYPRRLLSREEAHPKAFFYV